MAVADRVAAHHRFRDRLAELEDDDLGSLVMATSGRVGWATTHIVELDGHELFVKRLPLTDRELAAGPTTANVFELPTFYSYGVGSAGFGAYRELAAHEQASGLVLGGATSGFPLLHHHRVMARRGDPVQLHMPIDDYVGRWAGHPAIRRLVSEREASGHELWLVAERIPHGLARWFGANPHRAAEVTAGLGEAAAALNRAGTVHFDAHFGNALTDGDRFYLSDFGLALSETFDLDPDERSFVRAHTTYDRALITYSLLGPLGGAYHSLEPSRRERAEALMGGPIQRSVELLDHAGSLVDEGLIELPLVYLDALEEHRSVIELMHGFFVEIGRSDKSARYDDAAFARLLGTTS